MATPLSILLTGASSFTGAWFARALAEQGHAVTATLQRPANQYGDLEARRIAMIRAAGVSLVEGASYGNPVMADLIARGFDRLCFHGADVRDYRSADFDLDRAVASNTAGLGEACRIAIAAGTRRLIWTGTVFEPEAAEGDRIDEAITPYGLSKWRSWQAAVRHAREAGLSLGKFIVANPFGPLEQERFCTYLVRQWAAGQVAEVRTPEYLRDNIAITKLAQAYADFVVREPGARGAEHCGPNGYVETQGAFAERFARELGTRLGIATPLKLAEQTQFPEPRRRINRGGVDVVWDEAAFWDDLARDYAERIIQRD